MGMYILILWLGKIDNIVAYLTYEKNAIVIKMSNMTEKCDHNKNEEHDGGVHRHARKYKRQ